MPREAPGWLPCLSLACFLGFFPIPGPLFMLSSCLDVSQQWLLSLLFNWLRCHLLRGVPVAAASSWNPPIVSIPTPCVSGALSVPSGCFLFVFLGWPVPLSE